MSESAGQGRVAAPQAAELRQRLSELATRSEAWRFEVAPNPCVGAAVLADGVTIGEGFHQRWGGPHAEVLALEAAERSGVPRERWDCLLVTLEPCCSSGKTPPCTQAVLRSGIPRVVVGALDPDPRHAGRGLAELEAAGRRVELLAGSAPLERHAPHFLDWLDRDRVRRPRPWFIAKWAQTRTGQLIPPPDVGEGRWISSPEALREVQLLRSNVDALVTGVGTVLADDPRLSLRPPADLTRAPLRVILDSELRTPPQARILRALDPAQGEAGGPVHVFCLAGASGVRHRALIAAGAQIHGLHPDRDGTLGLRDVLSRLWELGVRRALLEAGPHLLASVLERGFADQLRIYTGAVNGGRGPSAASLLASARLSGRLDRECGADVVLEAFARSETASPRPQPSALLRRADRG
jgi:diaminohydroxyphosphoribosylaminopyrimidine deaminase/5-amino-6-(5-phosphoribosylamino)uracil reductase